MNTTVDNNFKPDTLPAAVLFNDQTLELVNNNGIPCLTAKDLSTALGYASDKAVTNLHRRNSDEFTTDMTLVVKMTTKGFGGGNSEKDVRIFTPRGCHLIAMFARTKAAKDFRKWVLDVLEKLYEEENPIVNQNPLSAVHAKSIKAAVAMRAEGKIGNVRKIYAALHNEFEVKSYKDINNLDYDKAISLIASVPLEGEYIAAGEEECISVPLSKMTYYANMNAVTRHRNKEARFYIQELILAARRVEQALIDMHDPITEPLLGYFPYVDHSTVETVINNQDKRHLH